MSMWIGAMELDLVLGDVHSLKEKRSVVRPIVADLARRHRVSVAEVDHVDLHRRAAIGVAIVRGDREPVVALLDEIERSVADRGEIQLVSSHRTLVRNDD